ncbi:MAG: arginine--tRNA ligase [Acidobacteriota bacterium]
MILPVYARLRTAVTQVLSVQFGLTGADLPTLVIETPPRRALGDAAMPVAFELARRLRKAPRAIAQELAGALGAIEGVTRVDAAPNGYLNIFLDRPAFLTQWLTTPPVDPSATGPKVIVEHTAINPNKAAHVGHLRNSALGDTLVRLLRFQQKTVEVQNYIDDTGVQVADVVAGFIHLEGRTLESVTALAADPAVRFDYYCWDLYAKVTEWYAADKARLEIRGQTMHAIEHGGNDLAAMGAVVADCVVRCHLRTMARMNVDYDLLTWEGDILRLQFWATAFEQLKARGAVSRQTEGRLAGCWVMPIEGASGSPDSDEGSEDDPEQKEKVIVRSNGTVTYVGKDIANQFWKFGLLGKDFHYRVFTMRPDGRPLWATTSTPGQDAGAPPFGRASAVYNVIDSRQAYLQQLLKQALTTIGFPKEAEGSTHFSYEMVALTHATARALGYQADESSGKPFVEVSGRKGLGVKADDLIDRLVDSALKEVTARNPDLAPEERRRTAEAIAIAAVRYFLVKFTRTKIIAFDIDEALSFEGETGPYIQYATVRAGNILAKLKDRDHVDPDSIADRLAPLDRAAINTGEDADELWGLVLEAARLDDIVDTAIRSLELSLVAKHAFSLAQTFNAFYHRQQILKEEREDPRLWRAAAVVYARRQLTVALDLMGCRVPGRM